MKHKTKPAAAKPDTSSTLRRLIPGQLARDLTRGVTKKITAATKSRKK